MNEKKKRFPIFLRSGSQLIRMELRFLYNSYGPPNIKNKFFSFDCHIKYFLQLCMPIWERLIYFPLKLQEFEFYFILWKN